METVSPVSSIDRSVHSNPRSFVEHPESSELLAHCSSISSFLWSHGYPAVQLVASDIDPLTKSISVYVVEAWAEIVMLAITELQEQNISNHTLIKDASFSCALDLADAESMERKAERLQAKYLQSEKINASLREQLRIKEKFIDNQVTKTKYETEGLKTRIKNLDHQIQELQRNLRLKEREEARLREKLTAVAEKEKVFSKKRRELVARYRRIDEKGSVADDTGGPTHASRQLPTKRNPRFSVPDIDLIDAFDSQNKKLVERNAELEGEVFELVEELQRSANTSSSSSFDQKDNCTKSLASDCSVDAARCVSLKNTLDEQHHHIQFLELQVSKQLEDIALKAVTIQELRDETKQMKELLENQELEINARPSIRQWVELQRSHEDLEDKVRDLTVMRGEAAEVAMWRKHLSTADRIKIDKRNHELGLWLLDSLPKTVMKETLQMVCRELDICELSDIQLSLQKLKSVVSSVPRMERVLSRLCTYVFERDQSPHSSQSETQNIEDILPIIKRWWFLVQKSVQLDKFHDDVLRQLFRRELLFSVASNDPMVLERLQSTPLVYTSDEEGAFLLWSQKSSARILNSLFDMVNFQVDVLKNKDNLNEMSSFIKSRPELICNNIISHVQYLFDIQSTSGILPRLNQVFLYCEQTRNFLATARVLLGADSRKQQEPSVKTPHDTNSGQQWQSHSNGYGAYAVSTAALLVEITRILQEYCSVHQKRK